MKNKQLGFSAMLLLIVLIAVLGIGGTGYYVYQIRHKTRVAASTTSGSNSQLSANSGITQTIDNIIGQQINSEANINSTYSDNDRTAAQSANTAAANLGGAFDETTF